MKERNNVFLYSPELDKIGYPIDCPFNTSRAGKTRKTVLSMGLLSGKGKKEIVPSPATRIELEKFHSPIYLDAIKSAESGNLTPEAFVMGLGTPDCPIFQSMYEYSSLACGASLTGARLILSGEADVAFNPSGGFHHAGPENASGFCYINDVVLAAMELADEGKRVLILDLDVHHCDGVQNAFYNRSDIMTMSLHESGKTLFPGTGFETEIGAGKGTGYSVNFPLPAGTYDDAYKEAFNRAVKPLIIKYNPDFIIIELGMDALSGDPLAHLNLTNNTYADILNDMLNLEKPILATGGGGYNVENTARGWALAWSVLCGEEDYDLSLGLGGVMLENIEWPGGLRDRTLVPDTNQSHRVGKEIKRIIKKIKSTVFPIHGI